MTTVCVGCGLGVVNGVVVSEAGGYTGSEVITLSELEDGNGSGVYTGLGPGPTSGTFDTGIPAGDTYSHKYFNSHVTNPDPCQEQLVVAVASFTFRFDSGFPATNWLVGVSPGYDANIPAFTSIDYANLAGTADHPAVLQPGAKTIQVRLAPGASAELSWRLDWQAAGSSAYWNKVSLGVDAFSVPLHA